MKRLVLLFLVLNLGLSGCDLFSVDEGVKLTFVGVEMKEVLDRETGCYGEVQGYVINTGNVDAQEVVIRCEIVRDKETFGDKEFNIGLLKLGTNKEFAFKTRSGRCVIDSEMRCYAYCLNCGENVEIVE